MGGLIMVGLFGHNQKIYENIHRMYNEGIQRVAVVQPTGSGKSLLMAKLVEDNSDSRYFKELLKELKVFNQKMPNSLSHKESDT